MSRELTPRQITRAGSWPVMVLAHNEERCITACLDSVFAGESDHPLEIFVVANGCTDRTEEVVCSYARRRDEVRLVSLAMPDKCNAWNHFIHEVVPAEAPGRDVYFFMDGDARIVPGSLTRLAETLAREPRAHAASAPPASGRSMTRDRHELIEGRHLVANLYALRGSFVEALRARSVRLPLGLEGDDGLLGALIKWDLDPRINEFDHRLIAPCAESGFTFDSVSMLRPRDWRGYWRRLVRYGRRRYEFQLLGPRLKRDGLRGLPRHISDIYDDADTLPLMWNGLYTLPNWIALRAIRSHAARKGAT